MKNRLHQLIALLTLAFNGCSAVYITRPIGETTVKVEAHDWAGTWIHKEGVVITKVEDSEKGILTAAWIETAAEGFKLETAKGHIRTWGEWMFGTVKANDDESKPNYVWGMIEKDDRQAIIWVPDIEKFKKLIKEGKLPGSVEGEDVFLGDLKPEHIELIAARDKQMLFDWRKPLVFIRVSK